MIFLEIVHELPGLQRNQLEKEEKDIHIRNRLGACMGWKQKTFERSNTLATEIQKLGALMRLVGCKTEPHGIRPKSTQLCEKPEKIGSSL